MIEVRLFATFRTNREKIYKLESEDYQTAAQILSFLQIEAEEVSILLINGMHSKPADKVKGGDVLALFPPVGGG